MVTLVPKATAVPDGLRLRPAPAKLHRGPVGRWLFKIWSKRCRCGFKRKKKQLVERQWRVKQKTLYVVDQLKRQRKRERIARQPCISKDSLVKIEACLGQFTSLFQAISSSRRCGDCCSCVSSWCERYYFVLWDSLLLGLCWFPRFLERLIWRSLRESCRLVLRSGT